MKNVSKLTEGAILLAVFAVLMFITIYIPILGIITNLVLPLPFVLFSVNNNLKYIGAFAIAAVFISFIAGSLIGLITVLMFGITGIVMGYMVQRKASRSAILIGSSLILLVGLIITYAVNVAFFHFDFFKELIDLFKRSEAMTEDIMKSSGKTDQLKKVKQQYEMIFQMIHTLAPSLFIFASIFYAGLIQLICFPIAKRFGMKVPIWGEFRNLTLPRSLLWYFLIAIGANMLFHPQEGTFLYIVLQNAFYILEMFMVIQGLSFIFFILYQKSAAKGLGVIIVILAFTIPTIHYIIMLLGITDMGFDFRKRFMNKE
ncbi:YybS family protein [Neobacillus fumarioli]|uniref:YybS family protein n=1 Tax=Neobacillus fumarioli TaxID=105229 RepID=UPI00082B877B|nr:YybS family protein [Neobacillus fumarioli]